ncbi:MAG: hypothetical protein A2629_02350 [Candidatus Levybacteria bacterium RIFCSPHIGHO2_01_FULL_41_15]|nr:MAG: hypothetical protein A2629_02350 [Candidatus Levybacteria bacterium RIFCSPHIGHO2_01_FULL_41_15]
MTENVNNTGQPNNDGNDVVSPPPSEPPTTTGGTSGRGNSDRNGGGTSALSPVHWAFIVMAMAAIALAAFILVDALSGSGNGSTAANATTTPASPAALTMVSFPTLTPAAAGTGTIPDLPKDASHGKWTIKENAAIDSDPIVRDVLDRLEDPNPSQWKYFPNVGNPDRPDFPSEPDRPAPWGAEYGVANVPFCQQDMRCDFQVPGWSYRLVTADYGFLDRTCQNDGTKGCLLLLINVSDQSFTWRNQMADNGFTVHGRYWDGDHLEWAILGLTSHASANMLNLPTFARAGEVLNAGGSSSNAGANCGNQPESCASVDVRVVVHAGERVLAEATIVVNR